ncbi:PKD domain-containing protein [Halapricum sp. CBA1109]|uniref:PKD domain-containing protein n=1 Tax=Halapricum sp. CBA1109 TaxID=2668068 RepID=UPI0012FAA950|nr:PKD domain-containing protein [Halapricum sp. CBA1109]
MSTALTGSIDTYEWDLDGDGTFEATGQDVRTTFDSAGTHEVTLRATSTEGVTDTETTSVQVGDPAAISVASLSTPANATAGNVTVVANVSNTGDRRGSTTLDLRVGNRTVETDTVSVAGGGTDRVALTTDLEPGNYTVSVAGSGTVATGWVSVGPADRPQVPSGVGPATDPDGDGQLEDVNGDGQAGLFDALTYYNERNSDVVQNNPSAFDFDGNGQAGTLFDALALFNDISD